jgi:hypothetical protein
MTKLQTRNSVVFSRQANYTDWATATSRRNLVPTFSDRGVSRGQRGGSPTVVNLSFLDRSCYFFFQVVPHLSSRGWVDPVPEPLLLRKSGSAENRNRDLWGLQRCDTNLKTIKHAIKLCNKQKWAMLNSVALSQYICPELDTWLCGFYKCSFPEVKRKLDNDVFWDVTSCGSCKNRRFGGT